MTQKKVTALVEETIAAAEVAEMAGFTGKRVWEYVRDTLMETAGVSENMATQIIQEAKRRMAVGPSK